MKREMMRTRELIYTGRVVDGVEAVSLGLALKSVPVEQLLPESLVFAKLPGVYSNPVEKPTAPLRIDSSTIFRICTISSAVGSRPA